MIWNIASMLACLSLCVKLLFFSDQHRQSSRWFYRVALFLVAVYAAHRVIAFVYAPEAYLHPLWALLHVGLLIGALLMRPEYLPWNTNHGSIREILAIPAAFFSRLHRRIRRDDLRRTHQQTRSSSQ